MRGCKATRRGTRPLRLHRQFPPQHPTSPQPPLSTTTPLPRLHLSVPRMSAHSPHPSDPAHSTSHIRTLRSKPSSITYTHRRSLHQCLLSARPRSYAPFFSLHVPTTSMVC